MMFFIIIYLLFQNFSIQTSNDNNNGNYEERQKQTDSTQINKLQETNFNSPCNTSYCEKLSTEQDKSPEKMKPPKFTPRKKKRSEPLLENALASLDEMAGKIKSEDACDKFGKYVASQLRELPLRQRILLQHEMQTAITNSILHNISSDDHQPQFSLQHSFNSPITNATSNTSEISEESQAASIHSDYSSTDETSDVIKKAMENTFDDFVFD